MTLQGEPQPHTTPQPGPALRSRGTLFRSHKAPPWSRRAEPVGTVKALVLAGAMIAAIAMTPPLSGQGAPWSPVRPSGLALGPDAVTFQRQAAPAVVNPLAGQPTPGNESVLHLPGSRGEWTIDVAGSGGQELVDACIGPVHYTPTDAFAVFITEHDYCGGRDRFSGIDVGQTVTLAGFGTYTVHARGQVPLGGTTSDVAAVFGGFPKAVLQTCIPGTSQMLVIALN
ncbi:hypothetical protein [Paenarthrobacter sp. YAF11_1]|uniref:hypothetical protein n=1 Tax=Paenarthrobacter sp. YAF11_1 TaxID=3233074 RepID=UPI003F971C42